MLALLAGGCVSFFDPVGELPKNDERSDVESVGARFIAPEGWGEANAPNSPTGSFFLRMCSCHSDLLSGTMFCYGFSRRTCIKAAPTRMTIIVGGEPGSLVLPVCGAMMVFVEDESCGRDLKIRLESCSQCRLDGFCDLFLDVPRYLSNQDSGARCMSQ